MKKKLPADDPRSNAYDQVFDWHSRLECIPTWQEMLELEYIRDSGQINMFDGGLQRHAFDRGLHHMVILLERCKEFGIHLHQVYALGLVLHEKQHGKRDTWLTPKIKSGFKTIEIAEKKRRLEQELRLLEREEASQLEKESE